MSKTTPDKEKEEQREWTVSDEEIGMLQSIEDTISDLYKQIGVLEVQKAQVTGVVQKHLNESSRILNQMRYKYGIPANVKLEYVAKDGKLRRK